MRNELSICILFNLNELHIDQICFVYNTKCSSKFVWLYFEYRTGHPSCNALQHATSLRASSRPRPRQLSHARTWPINLHYIVFIQMCFGTKDHRRITPASKAQLWLYCMLSWHCILSIMFESIRLQLLAECDNMTKWNQIINMAFIPPRFHVLHKSVRRVQNCRTPKLSIRQTWKDRTGKQSGIVLMWHARPTGGTALLFVICCCCQCSWKIPFSFLCVFVFAVWHVLSGKCRQVVAPAAQFPMCRICFSFVHT